MAARFPEADAAVENGGGMRAHIPAGPIPLKALGDLLPWGNRAVLATLSEAELYDVFENAFSAYEAADGRFLQVSERLGVTYDLTRPPGGRVVQVRLGGREVPRDGGRPVTLVIEDFLAGGGAGFDTFADLDPEGVVDTGVELVDLLQVAVSAAGRPLLPAVDGRIVSAAAERLAAAGEGGVLRMRGIVTVGTGVLAESELYLQDGITGAWVRLNTPPAEAIAAGTLLEVRGVVGLVQGQPRIDVDRWEAVADPETGEGVLVMPPHPMSVTVRQLVEDPARYIGALVACEQVRPGEGEPRPSGEGWVLPVAGGRTHLGTLGLRLDPGVKVTPEDLPPGPFSVVGVVARRGAELLLVPRGRADLP